MTKEELGAKIREMLLSLEDTNIGMVIVVGEEGSPHARIYHNMISDLCAGEVLEAIAPTMKRGDA